MTIAPEIVELPDQDTLAVRGDVPYAEMPDFFGRAFTAVTTAVSESGVQVVGPPFGFYPTTSTDTAVVEAGVPVLAAPTETSGEVHRLVLPGGRAVVAVHVGPYDTLHQTYDALSTWMKENDLVPAESKWEHYLSDPAAEPDPATWRTQIVQPLA